MALKFTDLPGLYTHDFDTVIDVRSPAEFAEDHLPGAINLPVLDNEERARVGTIYVQQSPFLARKLGAALVFRNAPPITSSAASAITKAAGGHWSIAGAAGSGRGHLRGCCNKSAGGPTSSKVDTAPIAGW